MGEMSQEFEALETSIDAILERMEKHLGKEGTNDVTRL